MRSWENATVDMCIGRHDPFTERKNEFLYGMEYESASSSKEYWVNPDVKSHFYLFNNLSELCELLIKGTKGIAQIGIIKRLLASKDIGLQIIKFTDGSLVTNICYGKRKDRINLDEAFTKELYASAKRVINSDDVITIYIELGFNYISTYNDAESVGLNIPFVSSVFIDSFGRKCAKILHSDLEPGFYDVQYYIWYKLSDSDKKLYRCENQWKLVPEKYKNSCDKIVALLKEKVYNDSTLKSCGNMMLIREMEDTVGIIGSTSRVLNLVPNCSYVAKPYKVLYGSTNLDSRTKEFIEKLIIYVSEMPDVHSVKWSKEIGEESCVYLCKSFEDGAVDLWVC